VIGLIAQLVLLATLTGTVGLRGPGWVVGITCGVIMNIALAYGLTRFGADALGPADRVTLTRATLVCGVAALTADSFTRPAPVPTLVALTVVALVLDGVDGWVARRTETASRLGARFDMEVDAFLIFVLSVYVARQAGWWVLAIGAARYAFVVAGWLLPWMRGSLPARYWRKVVAAVQGIVLALAVAGFVPTPWMSVLLAGALALLTESFGRDVWWLRRRRLTVNQMAATTVFVTETRRVGGTQIGAVHALSSHTEVG
jgi:phosphatidylglycerophosphate synthase